VEAGHPVVRIAWQDRYDLGGEVTKWFIATSIAGGLMGIDPFDEPNVQESKDRTKALLSQYVKVGRLPTEAPRFTDQHLALYGSLPSTQSGSVREDLADFLKHRRPMDYVALLSFLPRTPAMDAHLHDLRVSLARTLSCATTLGIGPRYLHSTGQLFKGGPDAGLFLLFTADETADLPIPGEPFTFGVLKQAQALGDFQAMCQRGRRIRRLHLGADPEGAMANVTRLITEVARAGRA
jgi:hypothetical protein